MDSSKLDRLSVVNLIFASKARATSHPIKGSTGEGCGITLLPNGNHLILIAFTRLVWKWLAVTNTLAYNTLLLGFASSFALSNWTVVEVAATNENSSLQNHSIN